MKEVEEFSESFFSITEPIPDSRDNFENFERKFQQSEPFFLTRTFQTSYLNNNKTKTSTHLFSTSSKTWKVSPENQFWLWPSIFEKCNFSWINPFCLRNLPNIFVLNFIDIFSSLFMSKKSTNIKRCIWLVSTFIQV